MGGQDAGCSGPTLPTVYGAQRFVGVALAWRGALRTRHNEFDRPNPARVASAAPDGASTSWVLPEGMKWIARCPYTRRPVLALLAGFSAYGMFSLPSVGSYGVLLALALWVSPVVRAQGSAFVSCADALAQAEERYAHEDFEAAEELVMGCMEGAEPADVMRGHRLLSLVFIRQGRMTEAQFAVLSILAIDYNYQPDEDRDPPFFVALVRTVQDQLRVDPSLVAGESAPSPARSTEADPVEPVAAAPVRVRIDLPEVSEVSGASAPGPATEGIAGGTARSEGAVEDGRINVNTASAADLQAVSGIGPALAERIVAYRTANGPFRSTDDLQNVRGVGPRSVERIGPQVTVGDGRFVHRFAAGGGRAGDAAPAPTGSQINLNTATAEELDTLPGIGPALAGRIIAYREAYGAFRTVEEVLEVRGVGPRVLEGFIDRVAVK